MRMGHIRSLDGVRGAAFLLVFLQHFSGGNHIHIQFIETFRGIGWTGVDLFFCLSGFLITGILYDTQREPHFYKKFYSRRALRIFSLYYLCLLLIVLTTPFLHLHWHLYHLCYPLYCSNFLNAVVPDGAPSASRPGSTLDISGHLPWRSSFMSSGLFSSCSVAPGAELPSSVCH
jgi:peptidoglycan/LPS O-acetylase OafA/YrhL